MFYGGKLEAIYRLANPIMGFTKGRWQTLWLQLHQETIHTLRALQGEAHPPNNFFDDKIINVGTTQAPCLKNSLG